MGQIVGRASERDPSALRLYTTCNRNFIENERPDERPVEAMHFAREYVRTFSPEAICRSLASVYNCMGLAFACRRTSIDIARIGTILEDDGFRMTPEALVMPGDLIVYKRNRTPQHVGVVLHITKNVDPAQPARAFLVLSQFGHDGEYIHDSREVPQIYGNEIEFWSERRPEQ